ncbi:hypothetical protein GCM10010252_23170 [Streptomyces aureoverticillatus]|nr:hypothetical protein GCM10010252_23170 [Streptomyces aureoverticillatus]
MDLAALDVQVEAVERVRPAERLVQPGDGDCLRHVSERTTLSQICEVKEVYKLGVRRGEQGRAGEMIYG